MQYCGEEFERINADGAHYLTYRLDENVKRWPYVLHLTK